MVEDGNRRSPPRENIVQFKQAHFDLPTITISSDPKRAREKRERDQRRCTIGRVFGWTILAFALVYYKQISGIMNGMVPQTVISLPRTKQDYSSIKGIYDLSSSMVKPRCFSGVLDCPCQDPLVPVKGIADKWLDKHLTNQQLTQSENAINVHVVFLGDGLVLGWGKRLGAKYNALALGIPDDTSPMLLWRLQNGELPANLNPQVFWLHIGSNDIGRSWCSPELVVIGVIRNAEEILSQKPSAQVVINGLLPRSFNKEGYLARGGSIKPSVWEDIKAINSELKMYATYRDGVSYFETDVFLKNPDVQLNQLQIEKDLMPDYFHPSPMGYTLWSEQIVKKLDTLIGDSADYRNYNGPNRI